MNTIRKASLPVLLAGVIAACSGGSGGQSVLPRISVLDDGHVAVHARGAPDAVVSADGNVAVTAQQQEALKRYYAGVVAIHKDAVATGKAGIGTAGTALKSVVS